MEASLPPHSFLSSPEGLYTLVSTLNIPPTTTNNPTSAPLTSASQPASTGNGGTTASDQPGAPPAYPSQLAVVSVRFPVKEGGGLNLSMSRKGKDVEPAAATAAPIPGMSDSNGDGHLGVHNGNGGGNNGGNVASGSGASPLMKRRPLITSSFSWSANGPAGGGGDGPIASSRPARAFKGSSSSFIRSWEGLPISQVQLRSFTEGNNGKDTIFGFQTQGKMVLWNHIGPGKKEPISKIIFSQFPTCIDANQHTASHAQVDVLIGFASGDILWMDPITARYSRFNKAGVIVNSPVTSIIWLPPAPTSDVPPSSPSLASSPSTAIENRSNLFLTSHADGTMLIWDKDREDWNGFVPNPPPSPGTSRITAPNGGPDMSWSLGGATMGSGKVQEGSEDMVVTRPALTDRKGQSTTKFNPVSHWKLSKKAITAFAFSPDLQLCAAVGEDGCLRIIDAVEQKLLDTYSSYFGALSCVSFSPDGRFVVTGGQDDLCTVYAPLEQHLVAHCQGHASWVTSIAWDPWRSEERTMRFISVGEDCKIVLWDLSSAALARPKAHAHPHARRHSTSSQLSLPRRSLSGSHHHLPLDPSTPSAERLGPTFHPAPRRDDVSLLQPVAVKTLSTDLFTGVKVLPEYLVTVSRHGQVKQYDRPPVNEGLLGGLRNEFAASVVRIDARAR